MKKKNKNLIIIILIIIFVIALAIFLLNQNNPGTTKEIAKCIGQNSILYTQLGCSACKTQENIFGKNYQYLNVIDCWFEHTKCKEIMHTPTWIINNKKYEGAYSIEKLQELTGCK